MTSVHRKWHIYTIQSTTYLTPWALVCATRGSCQVVLNGTPTHDPSTLVGSTNSGLLVQGREELNTRMRNLSGTLLRGTMSVWETKSSICNDTAYHPIRPVAEYRRVHYNIKWIQKRLEMQNVYEDGMLKMLMCVSCFCWGKGRAWEWG